MHQIYNNNKTFRMDKKMTVRLSLISVTVQYEHQSAVEL